MVHVCQAMNPPAIEHGEKMHCVLADAPRWRSASRRGGHGRRTSTHTFCPRASQSLHEHMAVGGEGRVLAPSRPESEAEGTHLHA